MPNDSLFKLNLTKQVVRPGGSRQWAVSLVSSGVVQAVLVAGLAMHYGATRGNRLSFSPPPAGEQAPASAPSVVSVEASEPIQDAEPPRDLQLDAQAQPEPIPSPLEPFATDVSLERRVALAENADRRERLETGALEAATLVGDVSLPPAGASRDTAEQPAAESLPRVALTVRSHRAVALEPTSIAAVASIASVASRRNDGAQNDSPPQAIFNPSPEYPPDALAARQTGRVLLRVRVDEQGMVETASVYRTSGVASLDQAAIAAVRRWRFEPARRQGERRSQEIAVPVKFVLD